MSVVPFPAPIPSEILSAIAAKQLNLESYLGQSVEKFCGKYGSVGDDQNHCAHFVSHVLRLRIPGAALCDEAIGRYEVWRSALTEMRRCICEDR